MDSTLTRCSVEYFAKAKLLVGSNLRKSVFDLHICMYLVLPSCVQKASKVKSFSVQSWKILQI